LIGPEDAFPDLTLPDHADRSDLEATVEWYTS
jgi:hypothetical protein